MTFDDYRAARETPDCFIVVPGHDDFEHDEVIERGAAYWIVETRRDQGS
jgi:hypothetical protein